ncbi:MAG: alpha/beta hydrolase [Candidatus Binatia bacterium]
MSSTPTERPFDRLRVLAVQEKDVTPTLRHVEIYSMEGLLTLLWHGPAEAKHAVLMCGGAMGGLLGPAGGLYHDLGESFAARGIATLRVGYRRPNDLGACVIDVGAAADLANRHGAERFVTVGHSFGGAVALNAAIALRRRTVGVVTLATQSAGCENAAALGTIPLLLFHGDMDELLPLHASEMVQALAGTGELVVLEGTGHLFTQAGEVLRKRLGEWIPERLASSDTKENAS